MEFDSMDLCVWCVGISHPQPVAHVFSVCDQIHWIKNRIKYTHLLIAPHNPQKTDPKMMM